MKEVSFVIDRKLVLILVDVLLKILRRNNAVSQKGYHVCRPFVFIEATNSCDNSRPVSRPFAYKIRPAADYVWYGIIESFSILDRKIIFPKLFNLFYEVFRRVTYYCEVFQAFVIGINCRSMPIIN